MAQLKSKMTYTWKDGNIPILPIL